MTKILGILAAGVLAAFVASPASATIIFQDDFNRADSNNVGNGWIELENNSNDVRIINNELRLRDEVSGNPDAAASQLGGLSSIGLSNITLAYDWGKIDNSSENSDKLHVQWKLASNSTWIDLATHNLGGSSSLAAQTVSLVGAGNVDNLQIRFWTDVSTSSEGARLDNVKLSGNGGGGGIAVPEPGTMVLFGIGLLGLGYLNRRRRND